MDEQSGYNLAVNKEGLRTLHSPTPKPACHYCFEKVDQLYYCEITHFVICTGCGFSCVHSRNKEHIHYLVDKIVHGQQKEGESDDSAD